MRIDMSNGQFIEMPHEQPELIRKVLEWFGTAKADDTLTLSLVRDGKVAVLQKRHIVQIVAKKS